MNPIARIERTCARFVEGAFARVFPSDLDPAQVGRKLAAVMQAAPGDLFLVRVHPSDYARFADHRDLLEARWSALLREALPAGRQAETPRALLHEDARIVIGDVSIERVVDDGVPPLFLERTDGTRVFLRDGLRLGRAADNDVVLRDARVSRRHARIVVTGGAYVIEDCNSSNGTFVDGLRTQRARLLPGATVVIGDTHLQARSDVG
jgi:hypothetical protein